jgi:penicillin G amidase
MEPRFDIWRDQFGVPHINSGSAAGVFQGLGYAHGRDRGTQTIFMRILGQGRVSELLNSDETSLGIDTFFRRMNWSGRMDGHLDRLDDDAREIVDAYSDGLNQALGEKTPGPLAFLGYKPEPWTPQDSILVCRMTGYLTLSQSQAELERLFVEMVQAGLSDELLGELFPGVLGGMDRELISQVKLEKPDVVPPDLWQIGAPRMMASNNWVIAGKRTESGAAILANDPHLEANRLPNIWYEAVLTQDDRYGMGATMPGIPGLLVGRTSRLSVGATYSFMDGVDSWIERCKDGAFYREDDGWKPFVTRKETIRRKKKEPVTVIFHENDHGVLEGDPTGSEERLLLSTRWTGRDSGAESLNAMTAMWKANTVQEGMDALAPACISFNWVFADADGSIGYQMSGKAPKRRKGISGFVPLPGWLPENDWQGMVAAGDLPRALNPECGYIVTSNQDLNAFGKADVINMPMAPYRSDRIEQLICERPHHSAPEMNKIQGDLYSLEAEAFMKVLSPLLPDTAAGLVLKTWDCTYPPESRGAYLFERFYEALRTEVFGKNGFGEDAEIFIARQTGVYADFYLNFNRIMLSDDSAWFAGEKRDDLFRRIAEVTVDEQILTWGETRKITMSHIILGGQLPRFLGFDRGPVVLPGSRATINQGQIYRSAGRTTTFAPSLRFATDMGTNQLHSNSAGGPSDRRFSRWYTSEMERWTGNVYKTLRPTPEEKRYPF